MVVFILPFRGRGAYKGVGPMHSRVWLSSAVSRRILVKSTLSKHYAEWMDGTHPSGAISVIIARSKLKLWRALSGRTVTVILWDRWIMLVSWKRRPFFEPCKVLGFLLSTVTLNVLLEFPKRYTPVPGDHWSEDAKVSVMIKCRGLPCHSNVIFAPVFAVVWAEVPFGCCLHPGELSFTPVPGKYHCQPECMLPSARTRFKFINHQHPRALCVWKWKERLTEWHIFPHRTGILDSHIIGRRRGQRHPDRGESAAWLPHWGCRRVKKHAKASHALLSGDIPWNQSAQQEVSSEVDWLLVSVDPNIAMSCERG